jgi:serine phosphatase RsbU (regulator of sigma subunit)
MTSTTQAVLAASFSADEEPLPAATRFTIEVMSAWAATSIAADAERVTASLVAQADGGPFQVRWVHEGGIVRVEVTREGAEAPPWPEPIGAVREWGVRSDDGTRTLWACLELPGGDVHPEEDWIAEASRGPGWLGFLADASDLLAGTLNPDMVPAIIAQVVVPRIATWCAVYTPEQEAGPLRLAYLWHADEAEIDGLRERLARVRIPVGEGPAAAPLFARGRGLGMMCLGRRDRFPEDLMLLAEDIARRAALAMDNARLYDQQAAANRALQRSLLPPDIPDVPGLDYHVVYEPAGEINDVGGDFYDLFPGPGENCWRFAIGDVCGTGPEAAAVTGLARHTLRLLAREGYGVAAVVGRLNQAILEEGERARFLTLLHGEISPAADGHLDVRLVSAGHPEALRLRPSGVVDVIATPQSLLGVFEEAAFEAESVRLAPGDVLLAVTDGVTERRSDGRLLDDDGGLAKLLAECAGLSARAVAERVFRAVQDFAHEPSADDLAILVLRAPDRH